MNLSQFNRIIKNHFLQHFNGFVTTGRADLLKVPMNHLWRGFLFAPSSYSKTSFYVGVNAMPLYYPTDFFYLGIGDRLRNGITEVWEWDEANPGGVVDRLLKAMKSDGIALLERIRTPSDFATMSPTMGSIDDPNTYERAVYSWIYAEQFERAMATMDDLCRRLRALARPDNTDWDVEQRQRNEELREILRRDPQAAKARLQQFEQQTIQNFKLEKFPN
jgi:hypothetical protein